jgi:hypothetical protein
MRYHVIGWPGMTGFMTAVKPGVCSVSLNARFVLADCAPVWFEKIWRWMSSEGKTITTPELWEKYIVFNAVTTRIKMLVLRGWTTGHVIRHAIDRATSYEEIKTLLESSTMLAPCYFIVAGTKPEEGCCITRDVSSYSTRYLCEEEKNVPFVVQTNDDYEHIVKWKGMYEKAPQGFNSYDRYNICATRLKEAEGLISVADAASVICTSFKKNGVRMQITLYMCVMVPSAVDDKDVMIAYRSTRFIGGYGG